MLFILLACGAEHARTTTVGVLSPGDYRVTPPIVLMDLALPPAPGQGTRGIISETVADDGQAPPTLLDPVRDAAFLHNSFVGNVRFGGGLIKTGDVALETRARFIELQDAGLRSQGLAWLTTLAAQYGTPAGAPPADFAVSFTLARGTDPDDDTDNLNLPRSFVTPQPIADPARLLVPVLRSYYTHNGGWFLGQRWGCLAGARIDVLFVLYDGGQPVWWREIAGRSIDRGEAQGTRPELDAHLLVAEAQVQDAITRR